MRAPYPLTLILLASLLLLAPWAVLPQEKMFGGTDALFYASLLKLAPGQFISGDFWPRWLTDANAGTGFPLMYYYPPLPYLLTAFVSAPLWLAGADLSAQFMFGMWLSQLVGGLGMYYWLQSRVTRRAALLGALFYVVLPYKFIVFYLHMNLGACWAYAWLPLWMRACDGLLRQRIRSVAGYAACFALVAYCHPLTLLAFMPLTLVYLLLHKVRPAFLCSALGLSIALIASYVVTFIQARQWLVADAFMQGKFDALVNLGHIDSVLSLFYVALAGVCLLMLLRGKQEVHELERTRVIFWASAVLALFVLTMQISAPLWQAIAPLRIFQFPFARLHAGLGLGAAWLLAWYVQQARGAAVPFYAKPVVLAVLLAASYAAVFGHILRTYDAPSDLTPAYVQEMRSLSIIPYPDYRLRWSPLDGPALYRERTKLASMKPAWIEHGSGNVHVTSATPKRITFDTEITSDKGVVAVKQLYAPVWKSNGGDLAPDANGFISLPLARGIYAVELTLSALPGQRAADIVTLIALLICVSVLLLPVSRIWLNRI